MALLRTRVLKSSKEDIHPLSLILAFAEGNVAVFNNYQSDENRSVLTELTAKDGNFLVSLNVGKGGRYRLQYSRNNIWKG